MDQLPDELLLHVIGFLEVHNILALQSTCSRLHRLGRDNSTWRDLCFVNSRTEASRRRQQLRSGQDERLAQLREAIDASGSRDRDDVDVSAIDQSGEARRTYEGTQRLRALADWDPSYPEEQVNFYQEYIHRHAPAWLSWYRDETPEGQPNLPECVGMGLMAEPGSPETQKLLASVEDGSVCVYDLGSTDYAGATRPKLLHESSRGLLTQGVQSRPPSPAPSNETEATDNLSIDYNQRKAYAAVFDHLVELDLITMQVVRRSPFPFPITTLSAASHPTPLTVGTNMTLHLHDPRLPSTVSGIDTPPYSRCELIAGSPGSQLSHPPIYRTSHATLSQPGPLSILHPPSTHSIYVAGRFTPLLHYDRRTFPKLQSTLFSGARLSSLALLPRPYIPRSASLMRNPSATIAELTALKSAPGATLIAAGEYKGKGSLELHDLDPSPKPADAGHDTAFFNRQTASKSRLLSVAPHGARLVFSDGDGNLKWMERDGSSVVRSFNISADASPQAGRNIGGVGANAPYQTQGTLFAEMDGGGSDIVRKIVPRVSGRDGMFGSLDGMTRDDLLLWTGDGRLGVLGFGRQSAEGDEALHAAAEDAEEAAKQRQERQYERRMREALERQADETRFVRGLGLGYGFGP